MSDENPFKQDREAFSALGRRAIDRVTEFLNTRPSKAVDRAVPPLDQRVFLANMALPEDGMPAEQVLSFLEERVMPWPMPMGHPRSYGWINSPPAPISLLADLMAGTLNNGLDGFDHPSIFLMHAVGRWLMALSGFSGNSDSLALLFSGGSAANLNAMAVARYKSAKEDGWNIREEGLQSARPPFIAYASDQAHSSIQRCVELLGIGSANLRAIPTDDRYRMSPTALAEAIDQDRRAGLRPFCVVAAAGSTNIGAIDPLVDIAQVCRDRDIWLHVDGAYGGIGGLDPRYTHALAGLALCDSLTLDPHKWLQVPLDCGALLVRDKQMNREAFSLVPDYLSPASEEADSVPWPSDHMFQLTYADRALKTWAAIARLGRKGVSDIVCRCNRAAETLGREIDAAPDLELLAPVSLSVVNFRYRPTAGNLSADALDALNKRVSAEVSASGEAHLPTTRVSGQLALRACFLHYENSDEDARHLATLVRRLGSTLRDD
ncbi:MAG: aminotransferase class V-fold PLP-dependent enzyme [Pseudomonadota bacterium]